jgi:hypothetical protein
MSDTEQRLAESLRTALDRKVARLDAATLIRLKASRSEAIAALDQASSPLSLWPLQWWPTAVGVAASVVLAFVLTWGMQNGDYDSRPILAESEVVKASMEQLDLSDDLEFYLWLEGGDLDVGIMDMKYAGL